MKPTQTTMLIDQLKGTPLFKNLAEPDLDRIAGSAHPRRLRAGEYYFMQGDPAERIYMLVEGRVKISQSSTDGQQLLMRVIGSGSLFGAVAMSHGEHYPVFAQADQDSLAVYWSKLEIMTFVTEIPQLAMNAIQMMTAHAQEIQERYLQMATERVERRLARTLLRLASQSGRKTDEGVLIDLPLTRQDLAEMTGTTLFTVSRTLSQWENQGLVIAGRERVVIRFPHGLVSIAEDLQDAGEDPTGR